ncbi:hypothetical protein GPECTOR_11g234 [Gonium pectorale]|uniref:Uncharacterized protein n=1 Tax=Gonium pectorale TaxID=33097 RepID=A0A150GPQ6_GONPE|nr:hypothetical protein GPECTOR_11g234 [Gonium pectorale]|eukprot:KXZ51791.1 hypothetical protein GPECTOR_11g234 [Gonium pectorale]
MRKRPIAHWDPSLAAAHVLLSYRAPYDLSDTQTGIVLRDLMDNGKWKWLRRPAGRKFKVVDPQWTESAKGDIAGLKLDSEIGYRPMRSTGEPKEYKQLKQQFIARADEAYFGAGSTALYNRYRVCSEAYLAVQQQYVYDVLQPTIVAKAVQAVTFHVSGMASMLDAQAAARREGLEAAAAALAGGVALGEEGVMDPRPFTAFSLPDTEPSEGPAGLGAQAEAAEALRAAAARAAEDESWGRVMRWGNGGMYLGAPGEGEMEPLPSGEEELKSLGNDLADVDTDELKESLENLKEHMGVAVDWLLSKMQDAQEGLSNLLEVIGIDFLDVL